MRGPAWTDVPTPAQLLAAHAARSPEDCVRIAAAAQGSDEWKRARYGIASGSTAIKAAGLRGPAAQRAWLIDMVWPEYAGLDGFAARMAAVGTAGEPVAAAVYTLDRKLASHPAYTSNWVDVRTTGFCMHPHHTWLGCSPDLIIEEPVDARPCPDDALPNNAHHLYPPYVIQHAHGALAFQMTNAPASSSCWPPPENVRTHIGTGEIKCIAAKEKLFYSERSRYAKYGAPLEYYGQIQVEMEVMDAEWNDFIVHTPTRTQVTRFYRDRVFFNDTLLPALRHAYFDLFLPHLQARADGTLVEPQTLLTFVLPSAVSLTPAPSEHEEETHDAAAPKPAVPLSLDLRAFVYKPSMKK